MRIASMMSKGSLKELRYERKSHGEAFERLLHR
jgi:hypothetical protein